MKKIKNVNKVNKVYTTLSVTTDFKKRLKDYARKQESLWGVSYSVVLEHLLSNQKK